MSGNRTKLNYHKKFSIIFFVWGGGGGINAIGNGREVERTQELSYTPDVTWTEI